MSSVQNNNLLNKLQEQGMGMPQPGARCCVTQGGALLSGVALFIIACIGAAGILPGSTMGWLAIGLGGGGFLCNLASGKLKERRISLLITSIMTLLPIVLGALGVTGILSGTQIGWGLLAPGLLAGGVGCIASCGIGIYMGKKRFQEQKQLQL